MSKKPDKGSSTQEPIGRSRIRYCAGRLYYAMLRHLKWLKMYRTFCKCRREEELAYECFRHRTPLLRRLKDVDMVFQYNKIINLKLAAQRLDGVSIRPGEIFRYWKLIGKPTLRKCYLEGIVLNGGKVESGVIHHSLKRKYIEQPIPCERHRLLTFV